MLDNPGDILRNKTYHYFFMHLANPLKVNIILYLRKGDKSVSEICKELKVEQSKVSHALANLKACNIVEANHKGKQRIYSLNKKTIVPMLKLIDKHAHTYCRKNCKFCSKFKSRC